MIVTDENTKEVLSLIGAYWFNKAKAELAKRVKLMILQKRYYWEIETSPISAIIGDFEVPTKQHYIFHIVVSNIGDPLKVEVVKYTVFHNGDDSIPDSINIENPHKPSTYVRPNTDDIDEWRDEEDSKESDALVADRIDLIGKVW